MTGLHENGTGTTERQRRPRGYRLTMTRQGHAGAQHMTAPHSLVRSPCPAKEREPTTPDSSWDIRPPEGSARTPRPWESSPLRKCPPGCFRAPNAGRTLGRLLPAGGIGVLSGITLESSSPGASGGGANVGSRVGGGSALPETGLLSNCLRLPRTRSPRCPLSCLATNSGVRRALGTRARRKAHFDAGTEQSDRPTDRVRRTRL